MLEVRSHVLVIPMPARLFGSWRVLAGVCFILLPGWCARETSRGRTIRSTFRPLRKVAFGRRAVAACHMLARSALPFLEVFASVQVFFSSKKCSLCVSLEKRAGASTNLLLLPWYGFDTAGIIRIFGLRPLMKTAVKPQHVKCNQRYNRSMVILRGLVVRCLLSALRIKCTIRNTRASRICIGVQVPSSTATQTSEINPMRNEQR